MFIVNCKYWGMRDEESFEFDDIHEAREFIEGEDCMSAELTDHNGLVVESYYKS